MARNGDASADVEGETLAPFANARRGRTHDVRLNQ
jgi:hypothetical protein